MHLVARSGSLFNKSFHVHWYPVTSNLSPVSGGLQFVRWRRMRLHPPNLNKRMMVPFVNPLEEGEQDEIDRLTQQYEANYSSQRIFLKKLYHMATDKAAMELQEAEEEEQEHREMMEYLNKENKRLAALREERERRELDEKLEYVMLSKLRHQEKAEIKHKEALKALEAAQELVKSFIPPERFASLIEHAYENPVDYNYAIDRDGFMYPGHNTKVQDVVPELRPRLDDPNVSKVGPVDVSCLRSEQAASV
ncbi:28S ribosomal protein S26 [Trinorchestia longiramus]|nr:28S ribosomal protein S26 [Trinorchestia longiramus]